jgi:uncharacterized protein (TIGR02246 family)
MRAVRLVPCLLALTAVALSAQAKPNVKDEVQAFVRAYTEAANRSDAGAYAAMYKDSPDLIVVSGGELKRGWSSIRDEANQMLGTEGSFKIASGTVDVLPFGPNRAVAIFPFVINAQTAQGLVQLKGALTLVLEKAAGKWLIIHDHTSYQAPAAR